MKKSTFTEKHITGGLREQKAGAKTARVCRKYGISPSTAQACSGERPAEALAGGRDAGQGNAEWILREKR
jgi:hypothetical protein